MLSSNIILIIFSSIVLLVIVINGQRVPAVPNPSNIRYSPDVNLTFVVYARNVSSKNVDPFVQLFSSTKGQKNEEKLATSEVIKNSVNPEFNTVFSYVWKIGTGQVLIFKLNDKGTFSNHPLGDVIIDVDQYVANKEKMNVSLPSGGKFFIEKTTPIRFMLYARGLPKLDAFGGMSDPFVKIYWKRGSNGEPIKLTQSQVVDNVVDVDWKETFEFPNYVKGADLWFVFKVRDHDGIGSDEDLGEALVEIDPFVEKRQRKIVRIGKPGTISTLGITPA